MMSRIMIVATLVAAWGASTVANAAPFILFSDDFDSIGPTTVIANQISSGYNVIGPMTGSANPPVLAVDYTVIFGYDYSVVTDAAAIPSAPNSTGGTTKGLYLTANKDSGEPGTTIRAGVNVYPVDGSNAPLSFSGNYSLKFDLWQNWGSAEAGPGPSPTLASAEQATYGINHLGTQPQMFIMGSPSDGLFYALSANGGRVNNLGDPRDFAVYEGTGASPPMLKTTGFTQQLGPTFDNADPGYQTLFPARGAFPNLPAGSPAEQWVQGEVTQLGGVISQYLNGTLISQYANTTSYTSGDIMLGYWDTVSNVGGPNNFAIFDNIRVCAIPEPSALALGGIAAAVMGAFVRRRKS